MITLNLFDNDQEMLQLRAIASSSEFKDAAEEIGFVFGFPLEQCRFPLHKDKSVLDLVF